MQQQFENHLLVPKVMEQQVGVSAASVIVGLLVGGTLLGIVGAILAVPTVAILQVIFQELTAEASPEDTPGVRRTLDSSARDRGLQDV